MTTRFPPPLLGSTHDSLTPLLCQDECELYTYSKEIGAPFDLVKKVSLPPVPPPLPRTDLLIVTRDHGCAAIPPPTTFFPHLQQTKELGRLPVVNFAAGGVATPADAALMMQLGMDGVFVGSGIFKSENPKAMAMACVQAVTHYNDPKKLMEVSTNLGKAMAGMEIDGNITMYSARDN